MITPKFHHIVVNRADQLRLDKERGLVITSSNGGIQYDYIDKKCHNGCVATDGRDCECFSFFSDEDTEIALPLDTDEHIIWKPELDQAV